MTVSRRIHASLASMAPAERRAARALLANYPLLGLRTVAEFAGEAGVSSPTVLRFVDRLGFANYAGLQDELHAELAEQLKPPLAKLPTGEVDRPAIAGAIVANIEATMASVPASEMAAVIDLLTSPRHPVFVTGGRFTDALARYLSTHLGLMRPNVHHLERASGSRRDRVIDMTRGTRLVCFDIRRYDPDLAELAAQVADRGGVVILLTDQWMSPVSLRAAHVLPAHVEIPSIWDSCAGLMALVEALLAGIAHEAWETTTDRLRRLEELRGEGREVGP